jgi:hypothetical protein
MTDIVYADFIDNSAPAVTGVWNAAIINANKAAVNSKGDKIGSMIVAAVAPTAGVGVNGQYYYNTATLLRHLKTSGSWDAGTLSGQNGVDGDPGADGTSFDMAVATIEPADEDKVANTAYFVLGSPTPTSKATVGGITYTAAEILSNIIVRDCAGASRTDTLPTATLLIAALPGIARVGQLISVLMVNGSDAAETITIAAGTGGSFDPNQIAASRVIPQNTSKRLHIRLTSVTGTVTYRVYM